MKTRTTHTPLPWAVGKFEENGYKNQCPIKPVVGSAYGAYNEATATAQFIVRACNNHYAMLSSIECAVSVIEHLLVIVETYNSCGEYEDVVEYAEDVIKTLNGIVYALQAD